MLTVCFRGLALLFRNERPSYGIPNSEAGDKTSVQIYGSSKTFNFQLFGIPLTRMIVLYHNSVENTCTEETQSTLAKKCLCYQFILQDQQYLLETNVPHTAFPPLKQEIQYSYRFSEILRTYNFQLFGIPLTRMLVYTTIRLKTPVLKRHSLFWQK